MFSCKKVRFLSPFFLLFSLKSCAKPPCSACLQTMGTVAYFSKSQLFRGSLLDFNSQCSSSSITPFTMKTLLDTVAFGIGSLEDMETSLEQMNVRVTPDLTSQVIHCCKTLPFAICIDTCRSRSRRLLRFFMWSFRRSNGFFGDDVFNCAIQAFAEMKDLTAMGIAISELQKVGGRMDAHTFSLVADTLVKAGKAEDSVRLFRNIMERKMELLHKDDNFTFITAIVHALCSKGYARKAEGVVWHHKNKIQVKIGGIIYMSLLHGWCINGNEKEAKRIYREMRSLGINPGLASYNGLLRCICSKNLKSNPSGLVSEASDLMMEMRSSGVTPTTVSFNILLSCLSRARRVKEAYNILSSMMLGEVESSPDEVSYYLVLKVLFLTKRISEGNRIIDHMIRHQVVVGTRVFHCLIGVLCGIEKVNSALALFDVMKSRCEERMGPTYDLLIEKLCRKGNHDAGRRLYDEAIDDGVVLQISKDLLDPLKTQVFKPKRPQEKLSLGECKIKASRKCRKGINKSKGKK